MSYAAGVPTCLLATYFVEAKGLKLGIRIGSILTGGHLVDNYRRHREIIGQIGYVHMTPYVFIILDFVTCSELCCQHTCINEEGRFYYVTKPLYLSLYARDKSKVVSLSESIKMTMVLCL